MKLITDIQTYMNTPEVLNIVHYWKNRYGYRCTPYSRDELLSEAYLGAWEAILKFYSKPFEEMLKLVSLAVKWKLCDYIKKSKRYDNIVVTSSSIVGVTNTNIEGILDLKAKIENLNIRERIIVTKTIEGYTMPEIGKELNISKQRVFQLLRKCGKDE